MKGLADTKDKEKVVFPLPEGYKFHDVILPGEQKVVNAGSLPESFISLKTEIDGAIPARDDFRKLIMSGLSKVSQGVITIGEVSSGEARPRKYTKPRSLKELVRESKDPKLQVYQRLIKLWPQIPENRLKEVIEHVDPSILRKILDLSEAMNKTVEFFEEFLLRELSYSQHIILDSLYKHYFVLAPKYMKVVKELKDGVKYPIEVDAKKYDFQVFFFVDGVRMPIDFYVDGWEKTLGLEYRFMPCVENIRKRIRELTTTINKEAENTSLEKIEQLRYALIDLEKAGKELIRINPKNIVSFPPKYNIHRFYISEQKQPLPCEYCNTHHTFVTIVKW